jgi:hypothetical protein
MLGDRWDMGTLTSRFKQTPTLNAEQRARKLFTEVAKGAVPGFDMELLGINAWISFHSVRARVGSPFTPHDSYWCIIAPVPA